MLIYSPSATELTQSPWPSSVCIQTLEVGKTLRDMSFDATGSYLHTKIVTVVINASSTPLTPIVTKVEGPRASAISPKDDVLAQRSL